MKISGESLTKSAANVKKPVDPSAAGAAKGAGKDPDHDGDNESTESAKAQGKEKSGGVNIQA